MRVLFLFALLSLTACTALNKSAGLGVVKQEIDKFNGETIISATPNHMGGGSFTKPNCVRMGASWFSSAPKDVFLMLACTQSASFTGGNAYRNITRVDVNINGQIQVFQSKHFTDFSRTGSFSTAQNAYTDSFNTVKVPFDTFESMLTAKDVKIRIYTSSGTEDTVFDKLSNGGAATAKASMLEMYNKVIDFMSS